MNDLEIAIRKEIDRRIDELRDKEKFEKQKFERDEQELLVINGQLIALLGISSWLYSQH